MPRQHKLRNWTSRWGYEVNLIDFVMTMFHNGRRFDGPLAAGFMNFERANANSATYFDANGVMQIAGVNVPRFGYDPATLLPLGYLGETTIANFIRNGNATAGAVAGTPGTAPTNWTLPGVLNGLSQTVVGNGVESGISYIDIRFNGTTTAAASHKIIFDGSVSSALNQRYTLSAYIKAQAGAMTGLTPTLGWDAYDGTPTFLITQSGAITISGSGGLNVNRQAFFGQVGVSAVTVQPFLLLSYATGATVDVTLRIGAVMIEKSAGGYAPTSYIPTLGTATVTRGTDFLILPRSPSGFVSNDEMMTAEIWIPGAALTTGGNTGIVFTSDDGTTTTQNTLSMQIDTVGRFFDTSTISGTGHNTTPVLALTQGVWNKLGLLNSSAGTALTNSLNGVNGTAANPGGQPAGLSRRLLATQSARIQFGGYVRKVRVITNRLPVLAEMNKFTS